MLPLESYSCSCHLWVVPSHLFHPPAIFVLFHSGKFELIKCSWIMQGSYKTKCPVAFHSKFSSLWIASFGLENISLVIPLGYKSKIHLIQTVYWFLTMKKKILRHHFLSKFPSPSSSLPISDTNTAFYSRCPSKIKDIREVTSNTKPYWF